MLERPSAWDDPSFPTENGDGEADEDDCLPAVVTIYLYRNGEMTLLFVKLIRVNADNAQSGKNG